MFKEKKEYNNNNKYYYYIKSLKYRNLITIRVLTLIYLFAILALSEK
jgi:hypothetical protein